MIIRWLIIGSVMGVFLGVNARVFANNRLDDYNRDVGLYRDIYSDYEINKSAYEQFNTYSAEELLIVSAKKMLLARADVWIAYWQLWLERIDQENNLPAEAKRQWQEKLRQEIEWLVSYKLRIEAESEKAKLLILATELNVKKENLAQMAFAVNVEVEISRLNRGNAELNNWLNELYNRVSAQSLKQTDKEYKFRGLKVNLERLGELASRLNGVRTQLLNNMGNVTVEGYSQLSTLIMPLYQELSQYQVVGVELAKGVEW